MNEFLQDMFVWTLIGTAASIVLVAIVFVWALVYFRVKKGSWSEAYREAKRWARSAIGLVWDLGGP